MSRVSIAFFNGSEMLSFEEDVTDIFNYLLATKPEGVSLAESCKLSRISLTWKGKQPCKYITVSNPDKPDTNPSDTALRATVEQHDRRLGQFLSNIPLGINEKDYLELLSHRVIQLLTAATQRTFRRCIPFTWGDSERADGQGACIQFLLNEPE